MASDYQLTLTDYLLILRRRALLIVITFAAILAVVVAVAVLLPPVYQSTGTIMVESQQISSDLIKATVTSQPERIAVIQQRVMTREHLQSIIDKYGLYQKERKSLTPTEIIDKMRSDITVATVDSDATGQSKKNTIAFTVSFEYGQPDLTLRTTNELVTLFLNENAKARSEDASQTTAFLNQEANSIKAALDRSNAQIAAYKQANLGALPEDISLSQNAIQNLQSQLRDTQRDRQDTQNNLSMLNIQLATARMRSANIAAAGGTGAAQTLSPQEQLQRARDEYAHLSATYTQNYPDVKAAKRRIAMLERQVASSKGEQAPVPSSPEVAAIQASINAAQARMVSLEAQEKSLQESVAKVQQNLARAPQVEEGLNALMLDQQTALKKYDEIRSKEMTAQVGQNLEQDKKAERFTLLEPPLMPDRPIKPNRKKLIALGFVAAVMGALGLAFALESLHGQVRGARALEAAMHLQPLAVIPYLTLQSEVDRQRRYIKWALIGLVILFLVVLACVHFFVMPLDIIYYKLLARLS